MAEIEPSPEEMRIAIPWLRDAAKKIRLLRGMSKAQCDRVVAGMVDGMALRTVPHPGGIDLPGIRPSFDPDYERGYDVGQSYAQAATLVQS